MVALVPLGKALEGRGRHSVWTCPADLKSLTLGSKKILLPGATSQTAGKEEDRGYLQV